MFRKPWDEIDRTLLRSKGSCYLLVITHETLLEVSPWNPHWLLLALEGGGGGQNLSVRQDGAGVKRQPQKLLCLHQQHCSVTNRYKPRSLESPGPALLPGWQRVQLGSGILTWQGGSQREPLHGSTSGSPEGLVSASARVSTPALPPPWTSHVSAGSPLGCGSEPTSLPGKVSGVAVRGSA